MPSRLSSLLEDQADALLSTFWWHADQKYGRTTRLEASIPRTTLGRIYRQARLIWENLLLRMALFYTLPYVLSVSVELERPGRLGGQLALLSFLAPWFYHIFIYTWFLDPLRHLPGPKGHWLFGLGLGIPNEDLGCFQRDFAKQLTPHSSPTGLFTYHSFGCRRLIPFSPTAISYFTNSRNYVRTEITRQAFRRITGEGILYVEGEEHRRQRRILSPPFAAVHIRELIPVFWRKGCELANTFGDIGMMADEKGMEVSNLLARTTLDIIGLAGFGYDFGALKDESNPVAGAFFKIFFPSTAAALVTMITALYPGTRSLPISAIQEGEQAKIVIDHAARSIIESRLSTEKTDDSKDILGSMLKENRKLEKEGDEGLSKDEMLAQILTFLTAGHETTSTALVWALYELSEHPEVQDRLREEIHRVLGKEFDASRPPTIDQLEQMTYLNNVTREVLRIDPPAPLTARQALHDDIYEGIFIPKDTIIHYPTLVVNTHPLFWGPDAEEFRPERWDDLKDFPNTNFLTFQHGPRSCIGRKFAEMEMKVILAALVGCLTFKKVQGWEVERYSLVTLRPKYGMYLHVSRVES